MGSRAPRFAAAAALLACVLGAGRPTTGEPGPLREPLLPFSTFLGGFGSDAARAAAFGPDGALWIAAASYSLDFPGAPRAAGPENGADVLVLRFDPGTREVLSSAWLGGESYDSPTAIAFDGEGNAYVAGTTGSADFPATVGSPGGGHWGATDAFLARLLPDGSGFAWVALLGGSDNDDAAALGVTADGDPVIAGTTWSADFPLAFPLRARRGGDRDGFLARFRADGSGIAFSTYLGGEDRDAVTALAAAPDRILVAGSTRSADFPADRRVRGAPAGAWDGFLLEVDPAGTNLLRGSLLGDLSPAALALEPGGPVLLLGASGGDAHLLRVDPADGAVRAASRYGGSEGEYYLSLALGPDGTPWVTGSTDSRDLPVPGAARPLPGGPDDAFVAAFSPGDLSLAYATWLPGAHRELGEAIAIAPDGAAWAVGATWSPDFPVADPLQGLASPWDYDVYVARLLRGDPAEAPAAPQGVTATPEGGNAVRVRWEGEAPVAFAVDRRLVPGWPAEEEGFSRVALLPPGTTEWVDGSVLPARAYEYAVQALGPAAGSPSSAASASAAVPESLSLRVERGTSRFVPDWFDGTSRVRLRGTLSAPRTLDPVRWGLLWTVDAYYGRRTLLFLPPYDGGWTTGPRGLRWKGKWMTLDWDPATGRFDLRFVDYGWFVFGGDVLPMRLTIGREAGTAATAWRRVTHYRSRIDPPDPLR